jgi:uncharacterized protein (DUF1330 family)
MTMKTLAVLLSGIAIGAFATFAVVTQTGLASTSLGIIQISEIDIADPDAYATQYAAHMQPLIKKYGGRFLAVGGTAMATLRDNKITVLDGDPMPPSRRVTVIAYDSIDQAKALRNDPEYQALRQKAAGFTKFRVYAVDAVQSTGTTN